MTSKEIKAFRAKLGWSREYFAVRLGCSFWTVYKWEAGLTRPSNYYSRALLALVAELKPNDVPRP